MIARKPRRLVASIRIGYRGISDLLSPPPHEDPVQSSPSLIKRSMTDPGVSPACRRGRGSGGQTTDTCPLFRRTRRQPRSGFRLGEAGGPQQGIQRVEGVGLVRTPPRAGYGCRPGSAHCRPVRERRTRGTTTASGRCIGGRRGGHNVPSGDASRPGTWPPYRVFRRRGPLGPSRRRWGRRGAVRTVTRPSCSWMRRMTGVAITRSPSAPHLKMSAPWRGQPVIGPGPAPPGRPGTAADARRRAWRDRRS